MTEFAAEKIGSSDYTPLPEAFRSNRGLLIWFFTMGVGYAIFPSTRWGELLAIFLALGVLWFMARRDDSGLLSLASASKSVGVGAVVGILLLTLLAQVGLGIFFSVFAPQQLDATALLPSVSMGEFAFSLLTVGLLIPFCEEYIFRWVVLRGFARVRSPLFAVLFSAFLFALGHGTPVYVAVIFPLGFMLGLLVLKTGQLWSAVLVHAALNTYVLVTTQFDLDPLRHLEIPTTPLVAVGGLMVALGALLLAARWLGLPSRRAETRGRLWSGSLVIFILMSVAVSILMTVSV